MPKVWIISFIRELEPFHLMIRHLQMLPQKSNVTPIASVVKNPVEIEAVPQMTVKTVNLWTICLGSGSLFISSSCLLPLSEEVEVLVTMTRLVAAGGLVTHPIRTHLGQTQAQILLVAGTVVALMVEVHLMIGNSFSLVLNLKKRVGLDMKNKGIIYVLSILLAIILLGGCSVVGTYNGLVSEQTKVEQAQANVATALQRRSDLIGNLVESVKGQMNHETEVFTQIAEARAKIGNGSVTSKENQEAQGELSSAISRLLVLTENYPELKSNQNVEQLMTELAGSENRIFVARKDYNQAATDYNQKLRSFPTVLFANMMNFKEAETFKESEEAKIAPKVDFSTSTSKQ